jgi:hypothetical protein
MSEGNQIMSDADQARALSARVGQNSPERAWPSDTNDWSYDDFAALDEGTAGDLATGVTSGGYVRAALKRRVRTWCTAAVVGLIIGMAVYVKFPASYQAWSSVLLANSANMASGAPIADDQAMAESVPVAAAALRMLGSKEPPGNFLGAYTVTVLTDRVLVFTTKADSSDLALKEAGALASAFLAYQAQLLNTQNDLVNSALQQQIAQAQQHVAALAKQISQVAAQSSSPSQQAELNGLRAEHAQAVSALTEFKQAVATSEASTQESNTATVKGSEVLNQATLVVQHRKKRLLEYVGAGLVGGLALGMAIVIVGALVSDRLRRRNDIAHALGAPVGLSVGDVRQRGLRSGGRGLGLADSPQVRHIVAYLTSTVTAGNRGPATLAVIPVDDPEIPAISVVSLATSLAGRGLRVMLADLCADSPAAKLLGAAKPGIHPVTVRDARLVVLVPDPGDAPPDGPLGGGSRRVQGSNEFQAAGEADVLITLAALDPSFGGEYLASWAGGAVAMVTAGRSTATRIRAVGEMARLAGVPLTSGVLVGADKYDESLGVTQAGAVRRDGQVAADDAQTDRAHLLATGRATRGREPSADGR